MTATLFPPDAELDRVLVGPDSVTWRRTSDARLYAVMLYPLLLQVAHPTVGAGVRDYSDFDRRPWNRLLRTIDYVTLLVYGGAAAAPAGRRLRDIHKRFRGVREDGRRYHALEPEAYAWVHATLIDTYVRGHRQFGTPMTPDEVECFYREYRALGRLIGVRARPARELAGVPRVLRPDGRRGARPHGIGDPRAAQCQARSAASRPDPRRPVEDAQDARRPSAVARRRRADEPASARSPRDRVEPPDEAQFRAFARVSRGLTPVMPERLRVMGPTQLRIRRRAIARGPLGASA